jgi:hypothetical protein
MLHPWGDGAGMGLGPERGGPGADEQTAHTCDNAC